MSNITNEVTKELMLAGRFLRHRHGRPRGQEYILKLLNEKGDISQKELQEEMGVQAASISEIASKLEFRGLVKRSKSDDDARAVVISLTEKGREKIREFENLEEENLYTSLSEEEMATLKEILTKLNNDWIRRGPIHDDHRRKNHFMKAGPHMMHRGPFGPGMPFHKGPEDDKM